MDEFSVRVDEDVEIELAEIDVGTAEGVLAFDVSGVIRGFSADELERVADKELVPSEISFEVYEAD